MRLIALCFLIMACQPKKSRWEDWYLADQIELGETPQHVFISRQSPCVVPGERSTGLYLGAYVPKTRLALMCPNVWQVEMKLITKEY